MLNILSNIYNKFKETAVGKLKNVYDKVVGKSKPKILLDSIRDVKSKYPENVQRLLNTIGNKKVFNIKICRSVVPKYLETLLNLISLGKFNEAKIKNDFDKFYHLYMTFDVDNKKYMLEKNQLINLSGAPKQCDEMINIPSNGIILNDMLENARKKLGDTNFFTYDAFNRNCQAFITAILKSNNLSSSKSEKFIYQNIEGLKRDLPSYVPKVTKVLTDIGGVVDTALQKGIIS
jgi:hypothetical protein